MILCPAEGGITPAGAVHVHMQSVAGEIAIG